MEADEGGVLAVAERRDEAEDGVIAEAEDGEADGLHEGPVGAVLVYGACDHGKRRGLRRLWHRGAIRRRGWARSIGRRARGRGRGKLRERGRRWLMWLRRNARR